MYKRVVPALSRDKIKSETQVRRNFLSFTSVIIALNRSGEHFVNPFVPNARFLYLLKTSKERSRERPEDWPFNNVE